MKTLMLCLFPAGSAHAESAGKPLVEVCVVQMVKSISDTVFVARMHCEPEGEAT